MKVYVDKLPKSCRECFCNVEDTWCALSDGEMGDICEEYDNKTRHKKCPLKTIEYYTKQVRKQVCEEMWKEFEQRLMNKKEDMPVMKVANIINSVLDKIQRGE